MSHFCIITSLSLLPLNTTCVLQEYDQSSVIKHLKKQLPKADDHENFLKDWTGNEKGNLKEKLKMQSYW